MPYLDSLEGAALKASFRQMTVGGTPGNPYTLFITGVTNISLTSTTLATAISEAETYLTTNGYFQITYWMTQVPSNQSASVWVS